LNISTNSLQPTHPLGQQSKALYRRAYLFRDDAGVPDKPQFSFSADRFILEPLALNRRFRALVGKNPGRMALCIFRLSILWVAVWVPYFLSVSACSYALHSAVGVFGVDWAV
jgi:hypothetical protein